MNLEEGCAVSCLALVLVIVLGALAVYIVLFGHPPRL